MSETEQIGVLALEDGALFWGRPFGAVDALESGRRGEVVFATGMTGYQEICTDPSYRGQMVILTYPLIGNYGVATADVESRRPWLSALIVRETCDDYSNWRAASSLDEFLAEHGIPGLAEVDTRALTRHLRDRGTLRGVLRTFPTAAWPLSEEEKTALVAEAQAVHSVSELDVVAEVAVQRLGEWEEEENVPAQEEGVPESEPLPTLPANAPRVLLIDTGYKRNIARNLAARGLRVIVAPPDISLAQVRELAPDGILLSNGPGDPERVARLVEVTRQLIYEERIPLFGICLGHQMIGLAAGAHTSRLLFGHHGSNHPVIEVKTGRVSVTSQNHNFQVDAATIPPESDFEVSHLNLSDGSVEGMAHSSLPVFSVQYHPEAAPGPEDNRELFDRFAALVRTYVAERDTTQAAPPPTATGKATHTKGGKKGTGTSGSADPSARLAG